MSLLQGTLDILIMTAVSDAPRHGYAIAEQIGRRTERQIEVEDAALYKALHRLEARGLLESEWGRSEARRRAKFYRLTAAGRRRLSDDTRAWRRHVDAVAQVIDSRRAGDA